MESIHITNPDGKINPRNFWLVKGKAKQVETEKPVSIACTFDNKDAAIRCAKQWALHAAISKVEVLRGDVEWSKFEPTAKADIDLFKKIQEANK